MRKVCLVWCFICVFGVKSEPITKTVLYNSSDISYLSNGIQFPVAASLEIDSVDTSEKMPEMDWIRMLFDHHVWSERLELLKNNRCQEEIAAYVEHLKNGTSWATKSQYRTFSLHRSIDYIT